MKSNVCVHSVCVTFLQSFEVRRRVFTVFRATLLQSFGVRRRGIHSVPRDTPASFGVHSIPRDTPAISGGSATCVFTSCFCVKLTNPSEASRLT